MEKGMIKVSMLFPGGEDETFDMDYYLNKHLPRVRKLLKGALKQISVEKGIGGGAPGSMPPYLAVTGFCFQSMDAFSNSFEPNAGEILSDISRFTTSKPLLQISEVVV